MQSSSNKFVPTERLRWLHRTPTEDINGEPVNGVMLATLQQWWALDAPSYMRGSEGEWRDVPVERE